PLRRLLRRLDRSFQTGTRAEPACTDSGIASDALGRFGQAVQLVLELREGLGLELADTLTRDPELAADLLERGRLGVEAEAQLEDARLPLWEVRDRPTYGEPPQRVRCLGGRVECLRIGEQVTQLAVLLGSDRPVERHGCVGNIQ